MASKPQRASRAPDPKGEFPFDVMTYLFHLFAVLSLHRDAALDKALRALGLNLARYRALSVIVRQEPCTMTQLAEFSAIERTTMTRTVDHLVASRLVERTVPPHDRRQVVLTLTETGRLAQREGLKAVFRLNRQLLSDIPETAQRTTIRAQQRMVANLVADPGPG
ncbi:MAG: MarR family winged helix-turn-helix transcriptional regulator [Caulobacterales bacterium]